MAFREWQDTEASEPLDLLINGKTYRIPALGHLDEIRMREQHKSISEGRAPTMGNEEFLRAILGDQLAAMRADNVPDKAIVHAAVVARTDAQLGREAAEEMWEHGPNPEALAAAMAAYASSITSPSTGAAGSSTRKRASTRNTSSRTKAKPSSGKTSSPSRASSRRTSGPSTAST